MSLPTLAQQKSFFETFGFLRLPGLIQKEVAEVISEFEAVFPQNGLSHDGTKRTFVIQFVDQRAGLCALLDHPAILEVVGNLLGPDFNYVSSDGNYYTGDTTWHRDSNYQTNSYIKMAFYLDAVTRDTGCLRVVPGSHTEAGLAAWSDTTLRDSEKNWGIHQRDIPVYAIESQPGDVLLFNHRTLHASFGGSARRRMFTMNLGRRARSSQEVDDLTSYCDWHMLGHGVRQPYGNAMTETASPARRLHLAQPLEFWNAAAEHNRLRKAQGAA
jgi:ectoine hydroxylase-related dioxygenase (phytanoyl-CoA dioxygenase family)